MKFIQKLFTIIAQYKIELILVASIGAMIFLIVAGKPNLNLLKLHDVNGYAKKHEWVDGLRHDALRKYQQELKTDENTEAVLKELQGLDNMDVNLYIEQEQEELQNT